jgi:hypothetical protein
VPDSAFWGREARGHKSASYRAKLFLGGSIPKRALNDDDDDGDDGDDDDDDDDGGDDGDDGGLELNESASFEANRTSRMRVGEGNKSG